MVGLFDFRHRVSSKIRNSPRFKSFIWKYITLQSWLGTGQGQIAFIKTIVSYTVYGGFILEFQPFFEISPNAKKVFYVFLFLGSFFVTLGIGWFWDVHKCFEISNEWSNARNPFVKEVRRKIR